MIIKVKTLVFSEKLYEYRDVHVLQCLFDDDLKMIFVKSS